MSDERPPREQIDRPEGPSFVRRGHFAYESGDHGDTWLTLELLFADPAWLQRAATQLADRIRGFQADLVCGPLVGGALVAQPVAAALGAGFVYAERQPDARSGGVQYALPKSVHSMLPGRRTVIVDDVINAGSATLACARAVEALGGVVAGAAGLIIRNSADVVLSEKLGVPAECLHSVAWNIWPARECPLCKSGQPLDSVG